MRCRNPTLYIPYISSFLAAPAAPAVTSPKANPVDTQAAMLKGEPNLGVDAVEDLTKPLPLHYVSQTLCTMFGWIVFRAPRTSLWSKVPEKFQPKYPMGHPISA